MAGVQLDTYVSMEEAQRIQTIVEQSNMSRSGVIRECIERSLDELEEETL
jgi:predicted DNA-binding protein